MKSATSAQRNSRFVMKINSSLADRREHRRHNLEQQGVAVERWDGQHRVGQPLGRIVDLSAGGVRVLTQKADVRADQHIRVRVALPSYAGISPFVAPSAAGLQPKGEWIGWMTVSRVKPLSDNQMEVAGRLVDMDEMDRGMLGLYLSTQPLAA
jgi:hypothetical protein